MDKNKVIEMVKSRLAEVGHGIDFEVIEDGVRPAESWWYVPVLGTRNGHDVPREVIINICANVEDELEEKYNLNVMLIPAVSEAGVS